VSKYLNPLDLILIAFSAYLVIWAANALLRNLNMGAYQA
jgi:hypothetical protein